MATRDPSRHYETPDPTPMAMPSGFRRPPTLAEQVARLVRSERFQRQAQEAGFESFEEADDFDVDDDPPDPSTPFEPFFDPALGREITPADIMRNRDGYAKETENKASDAKAKKAAAEAKKAAAATPPLAPPAGGPQEPEKPGS